MTSKTCKNRNQRGFFGLHNSVRTPYVYALRIRSNSDTKFHQVLSPPSPFSKKKNSNSQQISCSLSHSQKRNVSVVSCAINFPHPLPQAAAASHPGTLKGVNFNERTMEWSPASPSQKTQPAVSRIQRIRPFAAPNISPLAPSSTKR